MTFSEKIKSERERLGLTQAEAATLLDVSPRALWQWEQGQEPIALTQEGALARLERTKIKEGKCAKCGAHLVKAVETGKLCARCEDRK